MIEVVYEDNHLLVVNKPAGMLTQDSGRGEDNLEDRARLWLKEKYHKPGAAFLHAVHRLDREVSGLVLFAKTSKALVRLQEASRSRAFKKIYWAWVEGVPPKTQDSLVDFLRHGQHRSEVVPAKHPQGKRSELSYRLLARNGSQSLLEVELHTGRYHQIRAQLSAMGCPIVGDERYGASHRGSRILLHHRSLALTHPTNKESYRWIAELPDYFSGTMN